MVTPYLLFSAIVSQIVYSTAETCSERVVSDNPLDSYTINLNDNTD